MPVGVTSYRSPSRGMPRLRPASWSSSKVSGPSVGTGAGAGHVSTSSSDVVVIGPILPGRLAGRRWASGALALSVAGVRRPHHPADRAVAGVVVAVRLAGDARAVHRVLAAGRAPRP